MTLRVNIVGPFFDAASSPRLIEREFERANLEAAAIVETAANRFVRRDQGTYEQGWQRPETRFGGDAAVTTILANDAAHAATLEEGRRPNAGLPPVAVIAAWLGRKGGDPEAAWPVAKAIDARGIEKTEPVGKALRATSSRVERVYDFAGGRIAFQLGG